MTRDPERVSDLTEKSGGLKNSLDADQLPSSSEDGAVHKECVSSDPGGAVPAPGSPILRLNRDMRCKTQCREKIAACEPERGTRNPGEPTHLEAREGFEGDFCMSYVLVINQQKQPCQPVHPAQARRLLRSEEHTSELQSHLNLVCRLLLEKKKTHTDSTKELVTCDWRLISSG